MPICFKFVSEVHSLFRLTKTYVFDCSIRVLSYSFIIIPYNGKLVRQKTFTNSPLEVHSRENIRGLQVSKLF